jgi:3-(3-hydroxy-phenyl)propionate hydroxylase
MPSAHQNPVFDYVPSPDLYAKNPAHHRVIIVGAGPVGLACAADLALHGIETVLLDDNNTVSVGSRGICHAKRTLEILDRLGCGDVVADKGVQWNVGRVYLGERELYSFDLQPETGHKRPAFVNLPQYFVEEALVNRVNNLQKTDLRWKNKVISVKNFPYHVELEIETPDGKYSITCDWLIACDGARSMIRESLGLSFKGQVFEDRFLIADVIMQADFPSERRFWFDPTFHPGQSALLHKQPYNLWRIDFQLGRDADPELEKQPERVIPRIKAMLGDDVPFELEWVSVYTFQCRRMKKFRHGRILFAGDSAHQVSPFGARGGNGGVQDADNLAWKLSLVLNKKAPPNLLDTYHEERSFAADENILNSTRSTDFLSPQSKISQVFRDATLELAEHHPFARKLVNSGRLSVPAIYSETMLNTGDSAPFKCTLAPGMPAVDAPIMLDGRKTWLMDLLHGGFTGLFFCGRHGLSEEEVKTLHALMIQPIPIAAIIVAPPSPHTKFQAPSRTRLIEDPEGLIAQRYDGKPGTYYLFRPDQHICARWRKLDSQEILHAQARATCNG